MWAARTLGGGLGSRGAAAWLTWGVLTRSVCVGGGGVNAVDMARGQKRCQTTTSVMSMLKSKVVSAKDAASLVRDEDTVCMSGFVTQGIAETVLKNLETRFLETEQPRDLTLMFYGCGDPGGTRGTNHFRHKGMLRRVIASHFGQSPDLQPMILNNEIEAYSLPMGSISRMVRAKASGTPGHFTRVGLRTFVDPRNGGGRVNDISRDELVELLELDGQEWLRYKPLRIDVGIIRATTCDHDGNLTIEHESVCPDINVIASAVRASGGVVIAQVDRVAENGSLRMRDVKVPGALVDCVVVAEPEDVSMSFYTKYNPAWSGEIRAPLDAMEPLPMSPRKIIARRAALELDPDDIVNLGIGMPEGVANVSAEERILPSITLTTEAGMIGGIGASGHDFGPATNAKAMLDINEQFDFYNGGGLNICFLGAAEVDGNGNVNVSKLSESKLTGPGGFIDITQSTHRVVFMGTFKKKGLKTSVSDKGQLVIDRDGEIPMFRESVRQVTFNGDLSRDQAQSVTYITERAVFKLMPEGLVLTEVAPGIDVQKDVLDQMECTPIVPDGPVPLMDRRIFREERMDIIADFYQYGEAFTNRFHFDVDEDTLFVDLSGMVIKDRATMDQIFGYAKAELDRITEKGAKKVACVSTYENSDIAPDLVPEMQRILAHLDATYFTKVRRLAGKAFTRQKLFKDLKLTDNNMIWEIFTKKEDDKERISRSKFAQCAKRFFNIQLANREITHILGSKPYVERDDFDAVIDRLEECIAEKFVRCPEDQSKSSSSE